MGDQIYVLVRDVAFPVEPVGILASQGWLPGIWVKYSSVPLTFSKALATVELSDGDGVQAGFLVTGPQHKTPVQTLSDMWTTDTRQREGGSVKADWGPFDAGGSFEFDSYRQLQRLGSRIATMYCAGNGAHKFYVYETVDLAERTVPGTGLPLVYNNGDVLYVSNRGRLTNEKETINRTWTGFVVASQGTDGEGPYLIIAPAVF